MKQKTIKGINKTKHCFPEKNNKFDKTLEGPMKKKRESTYKVWNLKRI